MQQKENRFWGKAICTGRLYLQIPVNIVIFPFPHFF